MELSRNRACGASPDCSRGPYRLSAQREAVAQLLKRKGLKIVNLFANRLHDSSFDKAAVLAEVKKTFLQVDVSGTALFAYVGHMSAGYYTYQQDVQILNEGTAIEKGKKCMQSRSSNTPRLCIMTYAGKF